MTEPNAKRLCHETEEASRVFFRLLTDGVFSINDARVLKLQAVVHELTERVYAFEKIVPQCSWPENRKSCCGDACGNATSCRDLLEATCADHFECQPCANCEKQFCEECIVECEDDNAPLCHDCCEEHLSSCYACMEARRAY